jgi:hypothetical protein
MLSGFTHFLVWQEVVADRNLWSCCTKGLTDRQNTQAGLPNEITVLKERVNHGIALSSERDEVDRKKRRAADTIHFLFP